jgi:dipeptidyl aminopeptidase/acylaminoacyl peptidase
VKRTLALLFALTLPAFALADAQADDRLIESLDVFDLEWGLDPQISPDGRQVLYTRLSMDVMKDVPLTNVWIVNADGSEHRPVLSGTAAYGNVTWSPDGTRIAYTTAAGERGAELFVRWMDTGQTALLSNLPASPSSLSWSPDGESIAFRMLVAAEPASIAPPPPRPEGAEWAAPVKVIEKLPYRFDGAGYLEPGNTHVFVIPADGGTPRQLTSGDFNHNGPLSWSPDGTSILLAANRQELIDDPFESELWLVDVESAEMTQLTDKDGPDAGGVFSPDGKTIAYLGVVDERRGYHNQHVYLLDVASGETRNLTPEFDRSVSEVRFAGASNRLVVRYDDRGRTRLATLTTAGRLAEIAGDVGSASFGRPYTSGGFSVADNGTIAYTRGMPTRPAEVAVLDRNGNAKTLTALNDDFFARRDAASVEEITWQSTVGDYDIQGWLVKPPNFDPEKSYPLILEIHGGPHTAYGPHFSPEIQLYAAAGNLVLYTNPRGSTSYGFDFANEIHRNYPGQDYDDLMSGVDAVIARENVDESRLYVTGGSGGGVLSAWIVGKTDRFAAAVVQKPVINWTSFALTADLTPYFIKYWFDATPWEDPDEYWQRSPLSLVGNVTTPTMLYTGEQDFRTPMSESEQYYQALKFRGIDTALVRVPERSHNLVGRPSHLIAKASNILGWFARYPGDDPE